MKPNGRRVVIDWDRVPPDSALTELRDRVIAELEHAVAEARRRRISSELTTPRMRPAKDSPPRTKRDSR